MTTTTTHHIDVSIFDVLQHERAVQAERHGGQHGFDVAFCVWRTQCSTELFVARHLLKLLQIHDQIAQGEDVMSFQLFLHRHFKHLCNGGWQSWDGTSSSSSSTGTGTSTSTSTRTGTGTGAAASMRMVA